MPIANYFYHSLTRKYISVFGSIFNKMTIERNGDSLIIPISYGPQQKWLTRVIGDKDLNRKHAISLPRMAFEISGVSFDSTRNIPSRNAIYASEKMYSPAPWDIEFTLSVMTLYHDDGAQIIEQILPYFKPSYSVTAILIDGVEPLDIHISLNSVSMEDMYDGSYENRQVITWNLSFTMKAWYFGPKRSSKIIKFIDVDINDYEKVITRPGLTTNGEPTIIVSDSIDWKDIEKTDDWGLIQYIEEIE